MATSVPQGEFDILICTVEPVEIPPAFAALGIRNQIVPIEAELVRLKLPQNRLPLVTYMRLWLPEVFAERYGRILYLDFDTQLTCSELPRLFQLDMGPYSIAGVLDKFQWHNLGQPVLDFADHNIPCSKYLNAGVLLIDTEKWIAQDLKARFLEMARSHEVFRFHDQSLINLTLKGNWAELSPVWNWQISLVFPKITQATEPKLKHYVGYEKPWLLGARPNNMARETIRAYQSFLAEHDLPGQFAIDETAMRLPLRKQIKLAYKQVMARQRVKKLMARHPDPFVAQI